MPKSDDCATLRTLSCWANLVVLSLNDWLPHSVAKPTITQLGQGSSYVLAFLHSIKKNTPFQASPHSVFPDFRVTLNTPPIVADKTWNFVHTEVKHNKSLLHQNYASSKWLQYKDCIVHVYVISSVQTTSGTSNCSSKKHFGSTFVSQLILFLIVDRRKIFCWNNKQGFQVCQILTEKSREGGNHSSDTKHREEGHLCVSVCVFVSLSRWWYVSWKTV